MKEIVNKMTQDNILMILERDSLFQQKLKEDIDTYKEEVLQVWRTRWQIERYEANDLYTFATTPLEIEVVESFNNDIPSYRARYSRQDKPSYYNPIFNRGEWRNLCRTREDVLDAIPEHITVVFIQQ